MVPFENWTFFVRFSNGKNRPPKRPVFKCFRFSNVSGFRMVGFLIPTVLFRKDPINGHLNSRQI